MSTLLPLRTSLLTFTVLLSLGRAQQLPPLQNVHRMTLQGDVRHGNRPTDPPGHPIPDLCSFGVELKPGQKSIEVRQIGDARLNNRPDSGCEADFDIGIPTVVAPSMLDKGLVLTPGTNVYSPTFTTPEGDVIEFGKRNPHAPDLSAIFAEHAAAQAQPHAHALKVAEPREALLYSVGEITGYVYDPKSIPVTTADLYIGWNYAGFGRCTTNGQFADYLDFFRPTAWFIAWNSPEHVTACNEVRNADTVLFENIAFCWGLLGVGTPATTVYYYPLIIAGLQNGVLAGNFTSYIGGSLCSYLLRPSYTVTRLMN